MALACALSSPISHELSSAFQATAPKLRISLSKRSLSRSSKRSSLLRTRIRAIKADNAVSDQLRHNPVVNGSNCLQVDGLESGNNNGPATIATTTTSTSGISYGANTPAHGDMNENGDLMASEDGVISGRLVENVNGNGVSVEVMEETPGLNMASEAIVKVEVEKGKKKKKTVEEIGQEEAWFKKNGQSKTEVRGAPGGRWSRFETYSTIERTLEIWGFVLTFVFKAWLNNQKFSYLGGMTEEKKVTRRKALAKWLKESILRLGPTFIKIGQQFSTRVDLLAQEYVDQLSELQDQVPPFPSEVAVSIVEEELGAPIGNIFEQFDYEPIAAASLGQVHRAKLKGQDVVVKVQRPVLKALFDIDLKNLRVVAEYLQKIDPKSDGAKRDWIAIYDECAKVLYQEIDYTNEAANAELFASNFESMDYVKVPTIYWDYTTPQVLTMEYVPGVKISKVKVLDELGVDRKRLGRYAVESFLEQILSHGFFHADPHPGNIAVDDVNGGRLIFYDFGMMGSINANIREGLLEAFYGIYEKDPDKVLDAMIQMGVLVPTGDMTSVRRTAQFFLNSFEERLAAQKKEKETAGTEIGLEKLFNKEEMTKRKKQRLAAIGEDLLAIAADQPFRFPATFAFVARAFSVLDGIGKGLDPRFDMTEIAKPYALELLKFREAGVQVILNDFRKRWDRHNRAIYNLFRQADRVERLAQVIERLEKGDLKLRVRTLESERAFQRVAAVQKTIGNAVAAGSLVNLATILYLHSVRLPAIAAYAFFAFFGLQVLLGILKVKKLDQRETLIAGTA